MPATPPTTTGSDPLEHWADAGDAEAVADPARQALRSLTGHQRIAAVLLVLLLATPFAVSMGRALAHDWLPSGDEAVIAVRVHDVLSRHPPLTGLPSTSDLYGEGIKTRHLGPIEFYLFALPVKVLGLSVGLLLGAGLVNLGSLLLALWVVLRRAGPGVAAFAAVVLAATVWSTGTAVLTDPISSNVGGYPLLCLAVLAWALACGDHRLLPVTAFVGSFAAQQHLGVLLPVAVVAGWGGVAFVGDWVLTRRHPHPGRWGWVLVAVAVAAVCWSTVAIDQVTGHPGNLTEVVRFAQDSHRATLGLRSGATQVLRAAGLPPWATHHDLTGFAVAAPLSPLGAASGVLVLVVMAVAVVVAFRRRPAVSRLAATALVLAGGGFLAGASVPASIEADRINLYRWTWALALCTTVAVGWLVGLAVRRWAPVVVRAGPRPAWAGTAACVAIVAAVTVASVGPVGLDDQRRDDAVFHADRRLAAAAVAALRAPSARPTMIVTTGSMAALSVAPAIAAQLADRGLRFQVPLDQADAYGNGRGFDPSTAGSVLLVVSAFGPLPAVPGRRLAEAAVNPDLQPIVDRLITATRGRPIVPSAKAPELLRGYLPRLAEAGAGQIAKMGSDPSPALTTWVPLTLLLDGYLASPRLDPADLQTLHGQLDRELTVWGDDRVAVYLLTVAELRAYRPALFG